MCLFERQPKHTDNRRFAAYLPVAGCLNLDALPEVWFTSQEEDS